MQKISFWEVQELECCARRAQNFLRLKYLGQRNRKNGKVEKKRKRKTKYTLEELIEEIWSISNFFSFWWLQDRQRRSRVYLKKKGFFLSDQIPLISSSKVYFVFYFLFFQSCPYFLILCPRYFKLGKFLALRGKNSRSYKLRSTWVTRKSQYWKN